MSRLGKSRLVSLVAGFSNALVLIGYITLRAAVTPDHLLGRVGSTARMVSLGLQPIGIVIDGSGSSAAMTGLLQALSKSTPSLFVDKLDLRPSEGAVILKLQGRIFCSPESSLASPSLISRKSQSFSVSSNSER